MEQRKALVAMSGGVDSSAAVYLMKEMGYSPVGVTMMLHDQDAACTVGTHSCCTPDDIEDARVVASTLGIPFHVVNFLDGFKEKIIDKFVATYLRGETPNPCIDCNRYMKFGLLFDMADRLGCEKVVTGHYATVEYDEKQGVYRLKRALDRNKDQTYVLYFLSQEQLSRLVFPAGKYEKDEIREIAAAQSLPVAGKHDSQDICFVPDGDYAGYIEREYSGTNINELTSNFREVLTGDADTGGGDKVSTGLPGKGEFQDMTGNILGYHKGYFHYTIGQRKGLGISAEHPLYVVDIIPEENIVILGNNEDLFTRVVCAKEFNLISMPSEDMIIQALDIHDQPAIEGILKDRDAGSIRISEDDIILRITAKVRYRAKDTAGILILHPDKSAEMIFDEPVRAVTPGQSLVAYDGDYCIGGGIIVKSIAVN